VLAVAAHPDDEILGCGGTLARHVDAGDEVTVVLLAEGVTSRDSNRDSEAKANQISSLREVARAANLKVGVTDLHFVGLADNRMDSYNLIDVVKKIEAFKDQINPNIVYTHFPHDLNVDHQITSKAVLTAFRPQPKEFLNLLAFFEVASSTEWAWQSPSNSFSPTMCVNIESTIDKKIMALREYLPEMRAWPHSRSIESIAHLTGWRGCSNGFKSGESFVVARFNCG
jgi:LmbE family N-acetylglucosaminyl deacetylase